MAIKQTCMQEVEAIMLKFRQKIPKIIMSLLLWSVLSCFIFFSDALNYSNRWTVQIDGDNEEANRLAQKHGFVNQGKVSNHLTTQTLFYLPSRTSNIYSSLCVDLKVVTFERLRAPFHPAHVQLLKLPCPQYFHYDQTCTQKLLIYIYMY